MADQPGLNASAQAPLYANGLPAEAVAKALADSDASASGSHTDYWASPERPAKSDVQEVLDIGLAVDRLVNKVDLQVARYPCVMHVQFKPAGGGDWEPLRDKKTGKPIEARITDSVPAKIAGAVWIPAGSNLSPQHAFPNHWESLSFRCAPTACKKIRVVLQRLNNKNIPVNAKGRAVDYSVAVKNLDIGFKVESKTDLPTTTGGGPNPGPTPTVPAQPAPVSNKDPLGSSVDYYIRDYFAADLNWDSLQAQNGVDPEDRDPYHAWRSEPQPRSDAVVPLYVDVRDGDGEGQVVDSFKINPLTSGVSFNLYYSNDDRSASSFPATDEVLRLPGLREFGSVIPSNEGLRFETNEDYLLIANSSIQWDPRLPWWVGIQFQPQFDDAEATAHVVLDSPGLKVSWDGSTWVARINGQDFALPTVSFQFNETLTMIVGANGSDGEVRFAGQTSHMTLGLSASPGDLKIGSDGTSAGDVRVNRLVIKQQPLSHLNGQPTEDGMIAYTGSGRYVGQGPLAQSIQPDIDSALLRIDPAFQGRDVVTTQVYDQANPFGVRGGPGHFYEQVSWTPVNREFRLYKGTIRFDSVKARYFKFEFTNLVAKPYSESDPVSRRVKIFPSGLMRVGTTSGGLDSGSQVNTDMGSGVRFSDQRGVRIARTKGYQDYKPTEALFTRDAEAGSRLRDLAPVFGMEPWHQDAGIPRFAGNQPHIYTEVTVEHDSKVAYYVGLRQLRAMRTNHAAPVDTDEYLFLFHDDALLVNDPGTTWGLSPEGGLYTGSSVTDFARIGSESLLSRRNVRGVQFAAVQTPPLQRLADADFTDPTMALWKSYGGAQITRQEDSSTGFGTTVRVRRQPEGAYWNYIEDQYATWDDIEDSDPDPLKPTWDDVSFLGTVSLATGGIEGLEYVSLPNRGRIYAAARVYAPTPLTAPLHVQIVGDNGEVLADQKTNTFQGQVLEWYASYTVGEGGDPPEYDTWDDVEAVGTWDDVEALGTWDDVSGIAGSFGGFEGEVTVRVIQEGATVDEFFVDSIALFEDAIIWEFSNDGGTNWYPAYDIRNNPDGALVFPATDAEVLDQQQGTELQWRVSGYRPNLHISSLAIRPWYYGPGMGILPGGSLEQAGPNRSPYDQFPATQDSPRFKAWNKPIPQSWWYVYRQWLLEQLDPVAAPSDIIPSSILSPSLYSEEP